ncbi:hypothetical protein BC939DRAFT_474390 [Gamsiella multidivaricata]|uniref:uncharacterized protein n=1 Tax=Gamsiella multidivaricata TaxID=101098 RepID=UPI0022208702|nr:uncharacterized protein BC939DRAFT_474390 [Gamsiella multidivaricata]KAI7829489.1 hypothetical protein BC939DRAFT_474390 [Gamsiella multidivaricata]
MPPQAAPGFCRFCFREFKFLKEHEQNMHDGDKGRMEPVECSEPTCFAKFLNRAALRKHYEKHHRFTPRCPVQPQGQPQESQQKEHENGGIDQREEQGEQEGEQQEGQQQEASRPGVDLQETQHQDVQQQELQHDGGRLDQANLQEQDLIALVTMATAAAQQSMSVIQVPAAMELAQKKQELQESSCESDGPRQKRRRKAPPAKDAS